jgi:predicted glycosyltransferase
MVDVWLDAVTPKDSLLVYALLPVLKEKGYEVIVTAKRQTQTTEVLELLGIPYVCVGKYGETLRDKLVEEQKRTLEFVELFDRIGLPKVLWTHGDVSAIRTAFGLQIPVVYSNDTPHAIHVAKLVCPLVDWLIAPVCFGKSWSKFGIPKSRIILYDGVEEIAWLNKPFGKRSEFVEELREKERVILFRNVEYKASYCKDVRVDVWRLVEELSKLATVVYLPRYEEEKAKLKDLKNVVVPTKPVLTFQILPYVDLVVGSGGTICREAALMGIPAIAFHFWDAVAKYLKRKKFPIYYVLDIDKIFMLTQEILKDPQKYRVNTKSFLELLESPVPLTVERIKEALIKNKT